MPFDLHCRKSLSTLWGLFWDGHREKGNLHLQVKMGKISILAEEPPCVAMLVVLPQKEQKGSSWDPPCVGWDGVMMDKAPKYLLDTHLLQVLKFISCRIKSRSRLDNSLPVRSELLGAPQ